MREAGRRGAVEILSWPEPKTQRYHHEAHEEHEEGFLPQSGKGAKVTNPKSKYRNPKQTLKRINFKNPKTSDTGHFEFCTFGHLNLFRISDFELRI